MGSHAGLTSLLLAAAFLALYPKLTQQRAVHSYGGYYYHNWPGYYGYYGHDYGQWNRGGSASRSPSHHYHWPGCHHYYHPRPKPTRQTTPKPQEVTLKPCVSKENEAVVVEAGDVVPNPVEVDAVDVVPNPVVVEAVDVVPNPVVVEAVDVVPNQQVEPETIEPGASSGDANQESLKEAVSPVGHKKLPLEYYKISDEVKVGGQRFAPGTGNDLIDVRTNLDGDSSWTELDTKRKTLDKVVVEGAAQVSSEKNPTSATEGQGRKTSRQPTVSRDQLEGRKEMSKSRVRGGEDRLDPSSGNDLLKVEEKSHDNEISPVAVEAGPEGGRRRKHKREVDSNAGVVLPKEGAYLEVKDEGEEEGDGERKEDSPMVVDLVKGSEAVELMQGQLEEAKTGLDEGQEKYVIGLVQVVTPETDGDSEDGEMDDNPDTDALSVGDLNPYSEYLNDADRTPSEAKEGKERQKRTFNINFPRRRGHRRRCPTCVLFSSPGFRQYDYYDYYDYYNYY